jgi:hypothetical protein
MVSGSLQVLRLPPPLKLVRLEQEADEQQEKANEWQEADDQQKEADEQPGYINSHWKVDHKGTMVLQRDRKSIY